MSNLDVATESRFIRGYPALWAFLIALVLCIVIPLFLSYPGYITDDTKRFVWAVVLFVPVTLSAIIGFGALFIFTFAMAIKAFGGRQ